MKIQYFTEIIMLIKKIIYAKDANIALSFCLLILPIFLCIGTAIEYSQMNSARSRLQHAIDAATLAASRSLSDYIKQSGGVAVDSKYDSINQILQSYAKAEFMQQNIMHNIHIVPSYSKVPGAVVMNTYATALYTPLFLGFAGVHDLEIAVTSSVETDFSQNYVQIVFLVDISQSMAIGATPADIAAYKQLPNNAVSNTEAAPCAFACHYIGSDVITKGDLLTEARAAPYNIKFKIDYAREAISNMISRIGVLEHASPGSYRASIYGFSNSLTKISGPTSDFASLQTLAKKVDVEYFSSLPAMYSSVGHTDIKNALYNIKREIENIGDGSTPFRMRTYLIIVTDGVNDPVGTLEWAGPGSSGWESSCSNLKSAGINIATIQAYYNPFSDPFNLYGLYVLPAAEGMNNTFSSCASLPSLSLLASDGPGILRASDKLFGQIVTGAIRLVN